MRHNQETTVMAESFQRKGASFGLCFSGTPLSVFLSNTTFTFLSIFYVKMVPGVTGLLGTVEGG